MVKYFNLFMLFMKIEAELGRAKACFITQNDPNGRGPTLLLPFLSSCPFRYCICIHFPCLSLSLSSRSPTSSPFKLQSQPHRRHLFIRILSGKTFYSLSVYFHLLLFKIQLQLCFAFRFQWFLTGIQIYGSA